MTPLPSPQAQEAMALSATFLADLTTLAWHIAPYRGRRRCISAWGAYQGGVLAVWGGERR